MNAVFELGGDVVQPETAHNLLRLIAEGSGEDDESDTQLRLHAVSAYYGLLQKPHIPDVLMKVSFAPHPGRAPSTGGGARGVVGRRGWAAEKGEEGGGGGGGRGGGAVNVCTPERPACRLSPRLRAQMRRERSLCLCC